MSATRGPNSEIRHDKDSYITPDWSVKRFLEGYSIPKGFTLFDPCGARGELISVVQGIRPDLRWLAMEIDPNCAEDLGRATGLPPEVVHGDFLAIPTPPVSDSSIITLSNPPYCLAQKFVEQALRFTKIVAYLLRLNFLEDGRNARSGFSSRMNPGIFILPNRPSFNGWGGDACAYAWMVFGDPAVAGRWTTLGQTTEEEIATWNAAARKRYPEDNPKLRKVA